MPMPFALRYRRVNGPASMVRYLTTNGWAFSNQHTSAVSTNWQLCRCIPRLPDLAAFLALPHHRRVGLALECCLESRQVRQRTVHAVLRDRVRIALDHGALGFGADLVAAPLTPGDEELLLGCKAVNGRFRRLALARFLVSQVSEFCAAEIANRFAQHELAVVMNPGLDEIAVELVHHTLAARLEFCFVLGRPPVAQFTLVVEAVADLMADDHTDRAVVHRVGGADIKRGWLQNAGRKYDLVQEWVVV